MKKRFIGLAGTILAFSLIFAGCGETPDDETDNQTQEQTQNGGENSGTDNDGQSSGGGTENGGGSAGGTQTGTSGEQDTKAYPYWDYTIAQGNTWNTIEIKESTDSSLKAIRKTYPITNPFLAEDMDLYNSYISYNFKPEAEGTYFLSFLDETEVENFANDSSLSNKVLCPICGFIKVVDSKNNVSSFVRTLNYSLNSNNSNIDDFETNIVEIPIVVTKEMVGTKVSVLLQSSIYDVSLSGYTKAVETINFKNLVLKKEEKHSSSFYVYKPILVENEVKRIAQDLSINYKNTPALIDIDSYNSTGVSFSLSEKFYTNRNGVYAPNTNVLENQGYSPVKNFYYDSYAYISQILSLDAYDAFSLSFEDKYKKYGEDYYVDFEFDKNENPGLSISNLGIDGQSQESGQFCVENYSEKKAEVKVFIFPCKKGEYNIEFKTKSDPVIVGKNNYYSIDYNNESAEESSKAFKETKLKHAGGLVKLTIDESVPIGRNGGVMGFIFDLKNGEKGKDFFIVAVRKNGYYVSKYSNVTNFSASNFGVSSKEDNTQEDGTTETEYAIAFQHLTLSIDENGNSYVYVYAYCNNDGSYDWKILNDKAADKANSLKDKEFGALDLTDDMILAEGTIPASETGYAKQVRNRLAVYANIYSNGYLNGTWDFVGTYK